MIKTDFLANTGNFYGGTGFYPGAPTTDFLVDSFDIDAGFSAGVPGSKSYTGSGYNPFAKHGDGFSSGYGAYGAYGTDGTDGTNEAFGGMSPELLQLMYMLFQWLIKVSDSPGNKNDYVSGTGTKYSLPGGDSPYTPSAPQSPHSASPTGQPAASVPGLITDPNDPSHVLSPSAPPSIQAHKAEIEAASRETGVPANRIAATMWAESRGDPNVSSQNPDGKNVDIGVMQINVETYGDVQKSQGSPNLNLYNTADNIRAGAWELRDKYMKGGNNWINAHAAYLGMSNERNQSYAQAVDAFYLSLVNGNGLSDSGPW